MKRKKLFKIIALDMVLILSTSSVFAATFAWYIAQRQASLSLQTIQVEGAMDVEFYWFKWNEANGNNDVSATSKLYGYKKPGVAKKPKTFTSFQQDFYPLEQGSAAKAFEMKEVFPNVRFTFAIKVTSNYATPTTIGLEMGFDPGESQEYYKFKQGVDKNTAAPTLENLSKICLAEALDIFSVVVSNPDDLQVKNFIESTEDPVDVLNYKDGDTSVAINNGVEFQPNDIKYFFFTIEFSDDSSTYYDALLRNDIPLTVTDNSGNVIGYVFRRPADDNEIGGSSNVYQALNFLVNNLTIKRM